MGAGNPTWVFLAGHLSSLNFWSVSPALVLFLIYYNLVPESGTILLLVCIQRALVSSDCELETPPVQAANVSVGPCCSTLPSLDAPYPMLILTGPAACGKRELAHRLCRQFNTYFRYG